MADTADSQQRARRQLAGQLLEAVWDERMEPRLAINRWPETVGMEGNTAASDLSLNIAYQALWHFEADEERHKSELFYLDAQLELLRQMADFLKAGNELPPYLLRMYSGEHQANFYYARPLWKDSWQRWQQSLLGLIESWQHCWALLRRH